MKKYQLRESTEKIKNQVNNQIKIVKMKQLNQNVKKGTKIYEICENKLIIDFRDIHIFRDLLNDIYENAIDYEPSSFGKTRLFVFVYEFLRAQGRLF